MNNAPEINQAQVQKVETHEKGQNVVENVNENDLSKLQAEVKEGANIKLDEKIGKPIEKKDGKEKFNTAAEELEKIDNEIMALQAELVAKEQEREVIKGLIEQAVQKSEAKKAATTTEQAANNPNHEQKVERNDS